MGFWAIMRCSPPTAFARLMAIWLTCTFRPLAVSAAPAALSDLPAPDAVFIGGSKGSLAAIVDAALDKNPDARICVSAIALETLSAAVAALTAKGRTVQVSQIAVSRAKAVGGLHLMMAQNPIYLITGE